MHTGPRREASAETNPTDTLISDSQLPETQETKILFLKPSIRSLVFVPRAPATDTVTRAPGKDTGGDEHTHMIHGGILSPSALSLSLGVPLGLGLPSLRDP